MEQNGYVHLRNIGAKERLAEGIMNQVKRHEQIRHRENPVPGAETTRQYRGTDRSHFSGVLKEYVEGKINVCVFNLLTQELVSAHMFGRK
jgi:hypothetical protein